MIKDSAGNQRFFGIYGAVVFDNKDPNNQGRLRLRIPQVLANVPTGWVWPSDAAGVSVGVPEVGQGIWAMFEGGDPSHPMWLGVFGKEMGSHTNIAIKPAAAGKILPSNFKVLSNQDGSKSIDLIDSLINVASVIDGGSA
jgi:hypothetical protein